MIYKTQYDTPEERETILSQNQERYLIEEQNLFEGNFLIFSDVPRLEEQITEIKNTTNLILLKQEGII